MAIRDYLYREFLNAWRKKKIGYTALQSLLSNLFSSNCDMGPCQSSCIWSESFFCLTETHVGFVHMFLLQEYINREGGRLQPLAHERAYSICVHGTALSPPGCSAFRQFQLSCVPTLGWQHCSSTWHDLNPLKVEITLKNDGFVGQKDLAGHWAGVSVHY